MRFLRDTIKIRKTNLRYLLRKEDGTMAEKRNPYATNQGGKIEAPHKPKDEPKGTKKTGNDLRIGK